MASIQARYNLQRELTEKLETIATLTESQIHHWIANQQLLLTLLSNNLQIEFDASQNASSPDCSFEASQAELERPCSRTREMMVETQTNNPSFKALLLMDQQKQLVAAYPSIAENDVLPEFTHPDNLDDKAAAFLDLIAGQGSRANSPSLALTETIGESNWTLIALLDSQSLIEMMNVSSFWTADGEIYLVPSSGEAIRLDPGANLLPQAAVQRHSQAIVAALAGENGAGSYENYAGVDVIGAYRWLPELDMALLVEQPKESALASSDDLAIVLISATLAVALFTALIASMVTRRITLPIIQLTATAVQIASGELDQKVPTARRDEIGILARAFNVMTSKLQVLYENLEQKVRERTEQLRKANAETNYRAMQLAVSAEIARVVTSILDRERLLPRVIDLIRDCFQAYFVAIYFVDEKQECAKLREASGWLGEQLKTEGYEVDLKQNNPVSRSATRLQPHAFMGESLRENIDEQRFPHTRAALVVPLKVGQRAIGVLEVHSAHEDAFAGDEIMVLETLAGQIAVAIENARAYEVEHQAVQQLRELEESRRRFLANMSRELRMPLNNIIGFSRVILKEIDGPITDLQREDLNVIHASGQQLLDLINDILDIAQLEAGVMELSMHPADVSEIIDSIIPTTNALLEGRPVELDYEIAPDLPQVMADPSRLRQVFVKLLSNAVRFTPQGDITVRAWSLDHHVCISISDTGIGIPEEYREKVFEMFQQVSQPGSNSQGTGLGLTLSKEIVEMHGGSIELESQEGKGTTFLITLPVLEPANNRTGIEK